MGVLSLSPCMYRGVTDLFRLVMQSINEDFFSDFVMSAVNWAKLQLFLNVQ